MKRIIYLGLIILLFSSCVHADFRRVAYFKDADKNRIYVYETSEENLSKIQKHAKEKMNTDGRWTIVLYYPQTDDAQNWNMVTVSPTFEVALERASRSGALAGYWRYPSGLNKFIESPDLE